MLTATNRRRRLKSPRKGIYQKIRKIDSSEGEQFSFLMITDDSHISLPPPPSPPPMWTV